ncbi:MAG: GtrA family protein [Pseudomonadota bacterium]
MQTWLKGKTPLLLEVLRYGISGIVVFTADYLTFFLCATYLIPSLPQIANIIGRLASAPVGYLMHNHFTFRQQSNDTRHAVKLSQYLGLLAFNMAITVAAYAIILSLFSQDVRLLRFATDILVMIIAYCASKFLIFR